MDKVLLDDLGQPAAFGAVCDACGKQFGVRVLDKPVDFFKAGQHVTIENVFRCTHCAKEFHVMYVSQEALDKQDMLRYWDARLNEAAGRGQFSRANSIVDRIRRLQGEIDRLLDDLNKGAGFNVVSD